MMKWNMEDLIHDLDFIDENILQINQFEWTKGDNKIQEDGISVYSLNMMYGGIGGNSRWDT